MKTYVNPKISFGKGRGRAVPEQALESLLIAMQMVKSNTSENNIYSHIKKVKCLWAGSSYCLDARIEIEMITPGWKRRVAYSVMYTELFRLGEENPSGKLIANKILGIGEQSWKIIVRL